MEGRMDAVFRALRLDPPALPPGQWLAQQRRRSFGKVLLICFAVCGTFAIIPFAQRRLASSSDTEVAVDLAVAPESRALVVVDDAAPLVAVDDAAPPPSAQPLQAVAVPARGDVWAERPQEALDPRHVIAQEEDEEDPVLFALHVRGVDPSRALVRVVNGRTLVVQASVLEEHVQENRTMHRSQLLYRTHELPAGTRPGGVQAWLLRDRDERALLLILVLRAGYDTPPWPAELQRRSFPVVWEPPSQAPPARPLPALFEPPPERRSAPALRGSIPSDISRGNSQQELREDPADGKVYTFEETLRRYRHQYTLHEIEHYWDDHMEELDLGHEDFDYDDDE